MSMIPEGKSFILQGGVRMVNKCLSAIYRFSERHGDNRAYSISLSVFRLLVSSMILLKLFMLFLNPEFLPKPVGFLEPMAYLNIFTTNAWLTPLLLGLTFCGALLWLLGMNNRWQLLFLFACFFISVRLLYMLNYGGDAITSIILLFVPFVISNRHWAVFKNAPQVSEVNHLSLTALKYIFCIIYFFSGLNKLIDISWLRGDAMHTILRMDFYNGSAFNAFIASSPLLVKISTWGTLIVEMLVPFLIWMRRPLWWCIIACLIFHVGIMILMHLLRFEIIMISLLMLFVSDEEWLKLRRGFSRNKA